MVHLLMAWTCKGGCSQGQRERLGDAAQDPLRCWDVPTAKGGHATGTTGHPGNTIAPAPRLKA